MEDIGDSADKEEEEVVATVAVDSRVDVGKEKVDDVEETGADRRESSMRLKLGIPLWKEDKELKKREIS